LENTERDTDAYEPAAEEISKWNTPLICVHPKYRIYTYLLGLYTNQRWRCMEI